MLWNTNRKGTGWGNAQSIGQMHQVHEENALGGKALSQSWPLWWGGGEAKAALRDAEIPWGAGGNASSCQGHCTILHLEEGTVAQSTLKAMAFLTCVSWEAQGAWALNFYFLIHDRQKHFMLVALKKNEKKGKQRQTFLELFVNIFGSCTCTTLLLWP